MSTRPPFIPDSSELVGLFYENSSDLGRLVEIESAAVPRTYRSLLDHNEHMTVTVEAHHRDTVDVRVLQLRHEGRHYSRKILLTRRGDGKTVLFGIVRLNFDFLRPNVRREIEDQGTPLGRILIRHGVMRQVQLVSLMRVTPGPDLIASTGLEFPETFGRTALIYCDGEPAVELLEIVTPVAHEHEAGPRS